MLSSSKAARHGHRTSPRTLRLHRLNRPLTWEDDHPWTATARQDPPVSAATPRSTTGGPGRGQATRQTLITARDRNTAGINLIIPHSKRRNSIKQRSGPARAFRASSIPLALPPQRLCDYLRAPPLALPHRTTLDNNSTRSGPDRPVNGSPRVGAGLQPFPVRAPAAWSTRGGLVDWPTSWLTASRRNLSRNGGTKGTEKFRQSTPALFCLLAHDGE